MRTLSAPASATQSNSARAAYWPGLMRRISRDVAVHPTEDSAALAAAVKALGGQRLTVSGLPGRVQVLMLAPCA